MVKNVPNPAKRDFAVSAVGTGPAAISMVKKEKSDVIVTDTKPSTTSGLETYLAVRRIDPETKPVMINGYRQEVEAKPDEARRSDAHAYIGKPIDMDTLIGLIDDIVQKRARGQK
jgi:DNA-binding NtrC family response regulator